MAAHTSLKVGGPADLYAAPQDLADLERLVRAAAEARLPVFVVGAGSNLLVRDGGVRGVVVRLNRLTAVRLDGDRLYAEAGVNLLRLVKLAERRGLSGLEFAAGIPGTVGGAIVMNAGTPQGETADVVERVWVLGHDGVLRDYDADALGFGYRSSRFLAGTGRQFPRPGIVVGAVFRLRQRSPAVVESRVREVTRYRLKTQPLAFPNAGSIFKNPPGRHAAPLIEAAGLKGMRVGDAQVSELHANFIVNRGRATARDVLRLIQVIERRVEEVHGVRLEREVRVVGSARHNGTSD